MELLVAWVLFPLVLVVLCLGCGFLVEAATQRRMASALLAPVGFAAIVVIGQFLTLGKTTAGFVVPVVVVASLAGLALGLRSRSRPGPVHAAVAAAAVFAVFAAPVVLSGEATVAGYIRLDDTATWLALTDRVMEHGRDFDGLTPSTYEATLAYNLGDGYPVGVFLPFGTAAKLVGVDLAWLIQPYMAFLAVLLSLALWSLATPLAGSRALRSAAAFVGAQPALLFGYYLWGGIKEVAAAALIAAAAASAADLVARRGGARVLVAPAIVCGALFGVLSAGAGIWLAPLLGAVAVLLGREIGPRAAAVRAGGFLAGLAVFTLPLLLSDALVPPTSSPLTDDSARGNLIGPLDPAQVVGIWPAGDFRLAPTQGLLTFALIVIACTGAAAGLAWCIRTRHPGPPVYVVGVLAGCAVLAAVGSPWVDGKAFATASPAIPFAAMLGVGLLATSSRRIAAGALALAVFVGVAWSNALAYRDVSLAPRGQLEELAEIGELVAGDGPSLITEYSPYAARHFLRDSDPESISDLRRHRIALTDGSQVAKGEAADTDEIDPLELGFYRTLVVHRSPASSRPPSEYELIYRGELYEAWQRPEGNAALTPRLSLGGHYDPYGVPMCADVLELARSGDLVAAQGERPQIVALSQAMYPRDWTAPQGALAPIPKDAGSIAAEVELERGGEHEIWLGGSVLPEVQTWVDGRKAGEVRHELNNLEQYVRLGSAQLDPGRHVVEVRFGGADLLPGSGGAASAVGPLVVSSSAGSQLVEVDAADARSLCGIAWDWIEVAP